MRTNPSKFLSMMFGLATVSGFLFLLFTTAAMIIYPGGTVDDPSLKHFQFFRNIFSDLGKTHTPLGQPNLIAMSLFMAAMISAGLGVFIFFFAFMAFTTTPAARILGISAAILAGGTGLCCVGIACTPCDLYLQSHLHFVVWAAASLFASTSLDLFAVAADQRIPRRLLIAFSVFSCMLCMYIFLLTAPFLNGKKTSILRITGQKLVVYGGILTLLVQSQQMNKAVRRHADTNAKNE